MVINAGFGAGVLRVAGVVAGLVVWAPSAFAQAVGTQFLTVNFAQISTAVPLSDWLTAGAALLLAATAAMALRARGGRGGRLLSALLAVVAGAILVSAAGQRVISEARAGADAQVINLVVSPGTLEVAQYAPTVMGDLQIVVTNTTGVPVQVGPISLNPNGSPFHFASPGPNACFDGELLAPGGTCIVYLALLDPT